MRDPLYGLVKIPKDDESWVYCEGGVVAYFEVHHKELGFTHILKKQTDRTPDFICLRNGKEVKVEIEYFSSSFFAHRHKVEDVDVVICASKDKEIAEVEIITLDHVLKPYWSLHLWEKYYRNHPDLLRRLEKRERDMVENVFGKW